jgi:hypothetical protein
MTLMLYFHLRSFFLRISITIIIIIIIIIIINIGKTSLFKP